jgi:amino acid transporter
VGITIGGGIFRKPRTLAVDVGDPVSILGLWVAFGLVSLCGALAVAELASMMPRTGGVYVYLHAAYGAPAAFVFGWLYLLVATPAAIGALAVFFAELVVELAGHDPGQASAWLLTSIAGAAILVFTTTNVLGARLGSAVQTLLTVVKVAALAGLVAAAFSVSGGDFAHLAPAPGGPRNLGLGAASVIWAYDGWVAVSMIAGEVIAAERLMRRIVVSGVLTIVLLYVAANVGYFFAMPVEAMARETAGVPQRIMGMLLGPAGSAVIGAAILCSVAGALNGNILAKPRVVYALARDGLTFSFLGRAHSRRATPQAAILIQSAAALLLVVVLRDFDRLTTCFVVVEWGSLLFAVGAVLVLRRRLPHAPRPFRTPGHPWVPLLFIAGTTAGLVAIVQGELTRAVPDYSPLLGLSIAAIGFPVYHVWRRRRGPDSTGARREAEKEV